jgi:clan AA aspartic protease (TIGR02281 family)
MSSLLRLLVFAIAVAVAAFSVGVDAAGLPRPRGGEPQSDEHGDLATLPLKYPEGTWLPLDLYGLRLRTNVEINGHTTTILIDTGAEGTVLNRTIAHAAGLDGPLAVRYPTKGKDATGAIIDGYLAELDAIVLGPVRVRGVRALVLPTDDESFALLGYDVLAHVDLFFAFDEGLVGIFGPGKGPVPPRAKEVRIGTRTGPLVPVIFDDSGRESTGFMLDTGSPFTTLDDAFGDAVSLPLDARFRRVYTGISGRPLETKGAYAMPAFRLGKERVDIGPVYAVRGHGSLLGNDVTLRHRTLLSSERATLALSPLPLRPAVRSAGPDGKPCAAGPCVKVGITTSPAPCLAVDIDGAWAGRVVEGLVDVVGAGGDSAIGGGFLFFEARVPAAGVHVCVDPQQVLTTFAVTSTSTPSLLRFHTRAQARCTSDVCFGVTGPVPASPAP